MSEISRSNLPFLRRLALPALTVQLLIACATPPPPPPPPEQPKPIIIEPEPVVTITPQVNLAEVEVLRTLVALQNRLDRVSAPLLLNNPDLCKKQARNLLGFTAKNQYSYSSELSDETRHAFGLGEPLQVISVLANSGADQKGVRPGDQMIAADDRPLPQGPNAERQAAAMLAPMANGRSSIKLTLTRDGTNLIFDVPLTRACGFRVELGNSDHVNSYSDGRRILITRGMIGFVQSDQELAYVIAKEMAHNVLGHPGKLHASGPTSEVIDNLIRVHPDLDAFHASAGLKAIPKELDASADTLSLYMIARAGYGIENAMHFWQLLATRYPVTVANSHTALHPATGYRLASMEKTVALVKSKLAGKKPLLP